MNRMNHKLLLVEDEIDLGNVMKQYLEINDFEVRLCRNGQLGLKAFKEKQYDLCILDVMMPEMDGFTLARHLKKINPKTPFIFLTAKVQKEDRIEGLTIGADDYITKPFEIDELVLRIKNILKRTGKMINPVQQIGQFIFDSKKMLLKSKDKEKRLTQQEAALLALLIKNKNELVQRSDILKELWGEDDFFAGRSMDVFISRLRKYLKADPNIHIDNVRGVGFILRLPK